MNHPAIQAGRTAVITGGAKGIGLAAARRFAALGMKLCLADHDEAALEKAGAELAAQSGRSADLKLVTCDVTRFEDVLRLKDLAYDTFGEVAVLMNNAGIAGTRMTPWDGSGTWRRIVETNLFGVIHGVQAFTEAMMAQGTPCAIVNTGSKEGITTPPGSVAYSVAKAGVKVLTEQLAHELREIADCRVSAHLLIPGWTFTPLTFPHATSAAEKPTGAWLPEQVVDFMLESMTRGDFYILCPDNAVNRPMDETRIRWAAEDLIHNRPALSRWHPDFKEPFAEVMAGVPKP